MSLVDFFDNNIKPLDEHLGLLLEENRKQFTFTGTKHIEIVDRGSDSVLVYVKNGDDLLTPEERLIAWNAGDNSDFERDGGEGR